MRSDRLNSNKADIGYVTGEKLATLCGYIANEKIQIGLMDNPSRLYIRDNTGGVATHLYYVNLIKEW